MLRSHPVIDKDAITSLESQRVDVLKMRLKAAPRERRPGVLKGKKTQYTPEQKQTMELVERFCSNVVRRAVQKETREELDNYFLAARAVRRFKDARDSMMNLPAEVEKFIDPKRDEARYPLYKFDCELRNAIHEDYEFQKTLAKEHAWILNNNE